MATTVGQPSGFPAPDDFGIVVGIDGYRDDIPELRGCVNDAQLFHQWLVDPNRGGLDPRNVTLIRATAPGTGKPIRDEIEDRILEYYRHQNETGRPRGRRLYLYFAGHGVTPQSPNDEDCGLVMGNAQPIALRSLPGGLAARRVRKAALFEELVLIMDCCRQVTGFVLADCGLPDVQFAERAGQAPYLFGFAAPWAMTAAERELPHPFDPQQGSLWQGVFTHALLRGLDCAVDQNGLVTSISLKAFVRSAVQELLPEADNQRPQIVLNENSEPIVFGHGMRVGLEVRSSIPVKEVAVLDGEDLRQLGDARGPDPDGAFRFNLVPARYVVKAKDFGGAVARQLPVQIFGETVHVQL